MRFLSLGLISLVGWVTLSAGATYECLTNAAGEAVLTRALATTHVNQTRSQLIQGAVTDFLRGLFAQQNAEDSQQLERKLKLATTAAKQAARDAINAGITTPTVAAISAQSGTVGIPMTPVPISATNAYAGTEDDPGLSFIGLNLPPGVSIVYDETTGAPRLEGTPTNPGTYNTSIRAYLDAFTDIFGSSAFTFTVAPAP